MAEYDPKFIGELLDKSPKDVVAHLDTLSPAERADLNRVLSKAADVRLVQEMVDNLNRRAVSSQPKPPQAQ
jgi:Mg/Co/Ni transporter MgtE